MNLQIGDQVEHYQITGLLAQGGMSTIYRAVDLLHNREVVIKVPDDRAVQDPALAERFKREVEITRSLGHPAIQEGLASGVYNRVPYLVSAMVDGRSLRAIIEERRALPADEALALFDKIADGVQYLHQNGVYHRDLKPENIIVSADGNPVILDFGMALTRNSRRVTFANTSSGGTPDYMAPEQIEGQRGDSKTDQYALGTILYEMLAGHPPFSGDNQMAVLAQHLNAQAPRLDKAAPGRCSPQLAAAVARMIQRNPADRYPDIAAVRADLQHLDRVSTAILATGDGRPALDIRVGPAAGRSALIAAVIGVIALLTIAIAIIGQAPK